MKTRDFFGETSPQTFVTRGLRLIPVVLGGTNMSFRVLNKASLMFGELPAALKFGADDPVY